MYVDIAMCVKNRVLIIQPHCIVCVQGEMCNLEKADILELTVNHLRQMVANTELQYSVGYSACVQEVSSFLDGFRYDDITRRQIVQHLCRRRPFLSPLLSAPNENDNDVENSFRPEIDADSSSVDYQHLRMCSYSNVADSTTGNSELLETDSKKSVTLMVRELKCPSPTPEPDQSSANEASTCRFGGAALANGVITDFPTGLENSGCKHIAGTVDANSDVDNNDNCFDWMDSESSIWRPW